MRPDAGDVQRDSEKRFHLLAEHAQDVIFRYRVAEPRGFEYVNPAVMAMTSRTPKEHYDDPDLWLKLVHPDDREALIAQLQPESQGGILTMRWMRPDGAVIWAQQHSFPIYDDDGNLTAIEGITREMADRRSPGTSWQALRDEIITSISHDLRTPLAAIKASIGVVLANEPPGTSEPVRRLLTNIDSAADNLNDRLAKLLELERTRAHDRAAQPSTSAPSRKTTIAIRRSGDAGLEAAPGSEQEDPADENSRS